MDWIPALATTGALTAALGAAIAFGRKMIGQWIIERVRGSVKHEFDVKLENVRAEIRASEAHLNAVRSTALTALATDQTALNERRLQAIDNLWRAAMVMKSVSALAYVIGKLNLDEFAKNMKDPATKQVLGLVEQFGGEDFIGRLKEAKDAS